MGFLKPFNQCCCCIELRLGTLIYSIVILIWGFIDFVIACSALGLTSTQRYKQNQSVFSVPLNGQRGYLVICVICNLYSIAVGIVGCIATGKAERIKSYNRKTLALTIHFFRMKCFDFLLQEVLNVVATVASTDARHWRQKEDIKDVTTRGSDSAFHFGQVINFMVGFCVHAYLVYCVWSYKKKLLDQSKGIFEGEPVMRVQKFEAQGLQMTHTTAPGQAYMDGGVNYSFSPVPAPGGAPPAYGTAPGGGYEGQPSGGYGAPSSGFGAPASAFGAPTSGFGMSTNPAFAQYSSNPDGNPPPNWSPRG